MTPPCSSPCGTQEVEVEEGELLDDSQDMSDIRYYIEIMTATVRVVCSEEEYENDAINQCKDALATGHVHREHQSSINFKYLPGLNLEGLILPELNMVDMILNQSKMG